MSFKTDERSVARETQRQFSSNEVTPGVVSCAKAVQEEFQQQEKQLRPLSRHLEHQFSAPAKTMQVR